MEVGGRMMEGNTIDNYNSKKYRKSIFFHHSSNSKGYFTRNPSLIGSPIKSNKDNKSKNY